MKDKTREELEQMPVTPELIKEVSRRVWVAQGQGKRYSKWQLHKFTIPDITLPKNFWPLFWELKIDLSIELIRVHFVCQIIKRTPGEYGWGKFQVISQSSKEGIAISFAWLQTKGIK